MFILTSGVGNYININGEQYSYFAGNNYLGIANRSELKNEAISAIQKYGLSFSASRETTGTSELHLKLEKTISDFKNREDTVVFASGYLGNITLLNVLKDNFDSVFIDEEAHPSILDGIPNDIKKILYYRHCDVSHLESLLKKNKRSKPLIITDGIFALTGEIAPLQDYYKSAVEHDAILVVDDAHATGVLGENGRGTTEYFNLYNKPKIYQTETMSKAVGAFGGFISGSKELIDNIRKNSSVYIGSTALPPPVTAAGYASFKIMKQYPELRSRLYENARYARGKIKRMDFDTTYDKTPIIPIFFDSKEKAKKLSDFLLNNKIIAPYIEYPVKIEKYLVRIAISAIHTRNQIEKLLELLKKWRDFNGIN